MNSLETIPEPLREAFKRFTLLTNENEEEAFWEEMKISNTESPEEIAKHLKEGLLLLSDQVDALSQKVKAKIPV